MAGLGAEHRGCEVRSGILRTQIATLRLRLDAPFPIQVVKRSRYRMRALRMVHSDSVTTKRRGTQ